MEIKKYLAVIFGATIALGGLYFTYNQLYRKYDQSKMVEAVVDETDQIIAPLIDGFFENNLSFHDTLNVDIPDQVAEIIQDTIIDLPQHLFTQLAATVFSTPEERLQFFREQGIDYCNETVVEYEPLLNYDIKLSKKYLSDQDEHDLLTALYDDDLVLKTLMPMSIRWISPEVGHGVFAEDDLPVGGFVGIYGGVVKDRDLVDNKDYAWAYPEEKIEGGSISLDAKYKGNELRLINDGKNPNCIVKYILGSDGLWHVCYLAAKDIKKGDQLLVSYGPAYWDTRTYGYQEFADA